MRILLKIIGGVFLLLIVAIIGVFFYIGTPYFSAKAGSWLTHRSGRNIALRGTVEMHPWSWEPRVVLHGVRVGNAQWSKNPDMFEADAIDVAIIFRELFKGHIVFEHVILDKPVINLEKNAKGQANWDFTENSQALVVKKPVPENRAEMPIIRHLSVHEGLLSYIDPAKNIDTKLHIDSVNAKDAEDEIRLKGDGSYQKQPFLLDVSGASVLQLRDSSKPYPFSIKTRVGGTSAEVHGTVQDPIKMEALDVRLDLKGENAADLFPLTGIALPPTPSYQVRGHLTREGMKFHFSPFSGRLGTSDLKGDVVWDTGQKTPYFNGTFISDNLDMKDLAGFVGAHDKPGDDSRVIPDAPLDISRLLAMNADVVFHGSHVRAPSLMDDFYLNISLKDGTLDIKPVSFKLADGKVSANLRVQGRETPPVITSDVTFARLSLAALFAPLAEKYGKDNVSAGVLGGNAELKGTGKSLRDMLATADGTIGVGMEGGRLSHLLLELIGLDLFRSAGLLVTGDEPVNIGCVVGDFGVAGGVMHTREFLIETDATTIRGTGDINLKNENLDMHLQVHSHEASLVSARSPLHVNGTFKHPKPGVDAIPLAERGGAAALLGLLAPPAALLAFISPGLGDKGNCAGFIRKMDRDTGSKMPVPKNDRKAAIQPTDKP